MSQNNGFRHYRNTTAQGGIHNKGAITLAFIAPKHVADLTDQDNVEIAVSVCSRDDNFVHSLGRRSATHHLNVPEAKTAKYRATITGTAFRDLLHTQNLTALRAGVKSGALLPGLDEQQNQSFINLIASARVRH